MQAKHTKNILIITGCFTRCFWKKDIAQNVSLLHLQFSGNLFKTRH